MERKYQEEEVRAMKERERERVIYLSENLRNGKFFCLIRNKGRKRRNNNRDREREMGLKELKV